MKVIERAASKWETVASKLYFKDHDVRRIERDCHYMTMHACRSVLMEWLEGKGRTPTTWDTLIKALREAELSLVARDLEVVLDTHSIIEP